MRRAVQPALRSDLSRVGETQASQTAAVPSGQQVVRGKAGGVPFHFASAFSACRMPSLTPMSGGSTFSAAPASFSL